MRGPLRKGPACFLLLLFAFLLALCFLLPGSGSAGIRGALLHDRFRIVRRECEPHAPPLATDAAHTPRGSANDSRGICVAKRTHRLPRVLVIGRGKCQASVPKNASRAGTSNARRGVSPGRGGDSDRRRNQQEISARLAGHLLEPRRFQRLPSAPREPREELPGASPRASPVRPRHFGPCVSEPTPYAAAIGWARPVGELAARRGLRRACPVDALRPEPGGCWCRARASRWPGARSGRGGPRKSWPR